MKGNAYDGFTVHTAALLLFLGLLASDVLGVPMSVLAGPAQVGRSPAEVRNMQFDAASREVRLELINESGRVLTAWSLDILADGEPHVRITRDLYPPPDPGDPPDSAGSAMPPGAVRKVVLPFKAPPGVRSVTVRVAAVVFDDRTGQGDQNVVADILDARRAERDALAKWLPRLTAARHSPNAIAALQRLVSDLRTDDESQTVVVPSLLAYLEAALASGEAGLEDPLKRVETIAAMYHRRYEAAVRHSKYYIWNRSVWRSRDRSWQR
jgi:hypothetical protein